MEFALSASSQYVAVAVASAGFTNPMDPGKLYRFISSTNCWVRVTTSGGSAAADTTNNHFVAANQEVYLRNPDVSSVANAYVKVIRDTADGDATLSLCIGAGGA